MGVLGTGGEGPAPLASALTTGQSGFAPGVMTSLQGRVIPNVLLTGCYSAFIGSSNELMFCHEVKANRNLQCKTAVSHPVNLNTPACALSEALVEEVQVDGHGLTPGEQN